MSGQRNNEAGTRRERKYYFYTPTGTETGRYNFELSVEVGFWNRRTKLGYAFDSSTGLMEEYRDNGCRLGWLIDRTGKHAFIYRENGSIDIRQGSTLALSGEDVLPDFTINIDL
ncbi:hypothetical protein ACFSUS_27960 [Spirosoma soli]|uniref:Uma2 family endonuclease n=1 Tax=Spirosoma soli TaxID=1770529 RepID=A0ABW5MBP6_9BACT